LRKVKKRARVTIFTLRKARKGRNQLTLTQRESIKKMKTILFEA